MENKTVFCGSARNIRNKDGNVFKQALTIDVDAMAEFIKNNPSKIKTWTGKDGTAHREVSVNMIPMKNPTDWKDFFLCFDDYVKPEATAQRPVNAGKSTQEQAEEIIQSDELPF